MGYRWKAGEELAAFRARQRHMTTILIADGLVRPRPSACENCSGVPGCSSTGAVLIHAHHPDYEHPEVIKWLCARCHRRESHSYPPIRTWADYEDWYRMHPDPTWRSMSQTQRSCLT